MKRRLLTTALLLGATGCADYARRSADRDVQRLLTEFSEPTLGYKPQVDAEVDLDAKPTKRSYVTLPLTRLPDVQPAPMTAPKIEVEPAPLGPVLYEQVEVMPVLPPSIAAAKAIVDEKLTYGPPALIIALPLDLFDAMRYGVRNSRDYRTQMESLYNSALDVTLQRYLFTPRPFVTGSALFTGAQADGGYAAALTVVGQAGVRQRLPLGGEIVASGLVNFVNALNGDVAEGEDASVALSGTIPLLRGAGLINLEDLIITERRLVYALRSFEEYRRTFAVELSSRYFRLIVLQRNILNTYRNYQSAADLTERTAALFAAGRINALQVQRAVSQQISAENQINSALTNYANSLDLFKIFLGMPVEQPLTIVPIDVVIDAPAVEDPLVIDTALRYRLDLQSARDRIEDARRGVDNAKNGLLPDLNLSLDGTLGNSDSGRAAGLNSDDLNYSARLELGLPVDRLAERNRYRRSLIDLQQASRDAVQVSELVRADVRQSLREIARTNLTLQLQRRSIEVAQQRLEYSNELLAAGRLTDSRDVVEAQSQLLQAQSAYDNARADLQIARLQFLRDTGLLRVDPQAGVLGIAFDRARVTTAPTRPPVAS